MRLHLCSLALFATAACTSPRPLGESSQVGFQGETWYLAEDTVRVFRWYPTGSTGQSLTPLDYLASGPCGSVPAGDELLDTYIRAIEPTLAKPMDRGQLREYLGRPQGAVRTPPPGHGRGLVLLLGGLSAAPWNHAPLAERIAGSGQEVVAWQYCGGERGFDLPTAGRIAATAREVQHRLGYETRSVSLVAWSFGGIPAVLLARDDSSYRGLLSLDSGVGYDYGETILRAAGVERRPLAIPWLQVWAGVAGPVARSRWLFDSATVAAGTEVTVPGLRHRDFAAPYAEWMPGAAGAPALAELARVGTLATRFLGAPGRRVVPDPRAGWTVERRTGGSGGTQ